MLFSLVLAANVLTKTSATNGPASQSDDPVLYGGDDALAHS